MKAVDSTPNKKEVFDLWMEGDHILVHLDATMEKVIVPSNLKQNTALTLKLSHLFQGRTVSNEEGINTYLKFNGDYLECILPWNSIFAMTSESGEQKIWPNSIQTTLLKKITDSLDRKLAKIEEKTKVTEAPEAQITKAPTIERKRPNLQRIK